MVKIPQCALAMDVPLIRSLDHQRKSLREIARKAAWAVDVHFTEAVLRFRIALLGCATEPINGLGPIPRNAPAIFVENAKAGLSGRIALFSERLPKAQRNRKIPLSVRGRRALDGPGRGRPNIGERQSHKHASDAHRHNAASQGVEVPGGHDHGCEIS